jgi:outer membrane receptor for ferrienterochelin and colicins
MSVLFAMLIVFVDVDTTKVDTLDLRDVVVTASRLEQSRKEAPVLVTKTDARMFGTVQAVTLSEGLSFQPGLRLEANCQNCGFTQVRLNGLQGPYTQILIDSRPVFSALNGVYGLEQIPARMVDRIEVTRGGGSAMFGAGAIAGTINVITREPQTTAADLSFQPSLIGGSVRDMGTTLLASTITPDYLTGITAFGVMRDRNWYDRNGDGFSEMVKLKNSSGGLKGFHYFSETDRLAIEGHWIREFRRGGEMVDVAPERSAITEQLDHAIGGGAATFETSFNDGNNRLAFYTSVQHTNRESYYGGNGGDTALTSEAARFYGATTDLIAVGGVQTSFATSLLAMPSIVVAGTEFIRDAVVDNMPGYGRQIDQRTSDIGAYAQIQLASGEPLSVALGARLDHLVIDGTYRYENATGPSDARTFTIVNPRVAIIGQASELLQWRAGYAAGFRGPQAFDEDFHLSTLSGEARLVQLSSTLQPERSHSATMSLNFDERDVFSAKGATVELFGTYLNAPFVTALTADTTSTGASIAEKRNGDPAFVYGLNIELRAARTEEFEVQVGATIQNSGYRTEQVIAERTDGTATQRITTSTFMRTPNIYGNAVVSWTPLHDVQISASSVFTGPMDALNERTFMVRRTPWFAEVGVKLSYDVHLVDDVMLRIGAGVLNLFDSYQDDVERGVDRDANYIYGPIRPRTFTFTLGLAYK